MRLSENKNEYDRILSELIHLPGYSVSRVSRECGMPRQTIYRIIKGETMQPSIRNCRKILSLYHALFIVVSEQRQQ